MTLFIIIMTEFFQEKTLKEKHGNVIYIQFFFPSFLCSYLLHLITAPSKYPSNVRGVATKANELFITWDVSIEISMRYLSASQLIIVQ